MSVRPSDAQATTDARGDASLNCDVLVIGSGAAGLCAALTASVGGLDVIVVEKEDRFGGASARSGGGLWVPASPRVRDAGVSDSRDAAMRFLEHEAGARIDRRVAAAFIDNAAGMLDFVEQHSPVRFDLRVGLPDYHCESPGASIEGRVYFTRRWDASGSRAHLSRLRLPMKSLTFLGVHIGTHDVARFSAAGRSLSSALYVARLLLLRAFHQVTAGRSLRLVNGNALVGGLGSALLERNVRLLTSAPARELLMQDGRVAGALVHAPSGRLAISARCGVVLATGGFPHDAARRAQLVPRFATNSEAWSLLPEGNSGDGIRMAEEAGGTFDPQVKFAAAMAPVSPMKAGEGALQSMPFFQNRAKPGIIAVTRYGKRFGNEGRSYHDFAAALLEALPAGDEPIAWLICDSRYLRRYGLGAVRPAPIPHRKHVRSGYLRTGQTLHDLAASCGIDPGALEQTVARYNSRAREGEDPEFGRGTSPYDRAFGEPGHSPNPCVAPIEQSPYYAVRVVAGAVGTLAGMKVDERARVVGRSGQTIEGLYAVGNDMASITGGDYVAGGCTLGPGMTFGYLAGKDLVGRKAATG